MRFRRVLVANRGEVAVRVVRALHELGIEAVAVYSTADRGALHTRLADRAVCIGPPPAAESYQRIASIVAAAVTTGMGDKVQAKDELGAAGVPLVPGTDRQTGLAEARAAAGELGYPILL